MCIDALEMLAHLYSLYFFLPLLIDVCTHVEHKGDGWLYTSACAHKIYIIFVLPFMSDYSMLVLWSMHYRVVCANVCIFL